MTEREYRLAFYRTIEGYENGEYDVSCEYFDSIDAVKSACAEARKIEKETTGFHVLMEVQYFEWDGNEATDHSGFARIVG